MLIAKRKENMINVYINIFTLKKEINIHSYSNPGSAVSQDASAGSQVANPVEELVAIASMIEHSASISPSVLT
jgi:hypothetical protein